MRLPAGVLVVAACVLAAAGLTAYYTVRATAWAVMTDELQVALLATSIADSLSPVPMIHGVYYGAHSQLYPLLIAPFYGTLSAPAAATAAQAVNAHLLAGAAWPAYLLARSVAGSRSAGYVAAALTAFTPWLVLASTLLTENAAYPAFVWAVCSNISFAILHGHRRYPTGNSPTYPNATPHGGYSSSNSYYSGRSRIADAPPPAPKPAAAK